MLSVYKSLFFFTCGLDFTKTSKNNVPDSVSDPPCSAPWTGWGRRRRRRCWWWRRRNVTRWRPRSGRRSSCRPSSRCHPRWKVQTPSSSHPRPTTLSCMRRLWQGRTEARGLCTRQYRLIRRADRISVSTAHTYSSSFFPFPVSNLNIQDSEPILPVAVIMHK